MEINPGKRELDKENVSEKEKDDQINQLKILSKDQLPGLRNLNKP